MKQIDIDKNEQDQRIDRFLKKFLEDASMSFIYKMLRKKRIKLNNKRANPEDMISKGDTIQFYLSDETIEKFMRKQRDIKSSGKLDILYEDEFIALIVKPRGVLSHAAKGEYKEENIVDDFVSLLYERGEYNPRLDRTFSPSICNRLDRNTSGIIIGAKTYTALKEINKAIKNRKIEKFYKCLVKGRVRKDQTLKGFLKKDAPSNKVTVEDSESCESKDIVTEIRVLKATRDYSLLEVNLITGRTHQIRAHLSSIGHPIVGDRKYGDSKINEEFKRRYNLDSQFLHAYKVVFSGLGGEMEYLNGREFVSPESEEMNKIERDLFD